MDARGDENTVAANPGSAAILFLSEAHSLTMPLEPCFNRLWSEVLLKNTTPRRADTRVRKTCKEYYRIMPGFLFRGVSVLIEKPMLVGIDEEAGRIVMPFCKPCYGTSLYVIDSDSAEIEALRKALSVAEPRDPGKKY